MNNLNSFIMDGRLVGDPEKKDFENGGSVVKFRVAVNRSYKDAKKEVKEEVVFIPVDVFGGMGDPCMKYLHKGDAVRVMGRLKEDKWETEDKMKHSRISVVAERVDFLSKKKKDEVVTIDIENGTTTSSQVV